MADLALVQGMGRLVEKGKGRIGQEQTGDSQELLVGQREQGGPVTLCIQAAGAVQERFQAHLG